MSNGVQRRTAVPPPVRIRRDVANLSSSDRILEFYERAIARMKLDGLDNPVSWRYQGAIHGYPSDSTGRGIDERKFPARTGDPNQSPSDKFPGDANTFWDQCEHGGWFFLSWHRMYIHFFEKIIMKIVANLLGGPKDWALPYWNVSTSQTSALLPEPFRKPADITNNLFVHQRSKRINDGKAFLDRNPDLTFDTSKPDTSLDCLKAKSFKGVQPAFGGPPLSFHFPVDSGTLENAPHNAVHNQFGTFVNDKGRVESSFMFIPETAALDPIFWLHHSNIDRLWEVWIQRQKQLLRLDRNPKDSDQDPDSKIWLDSGLNKGDLEGKFNFHDENGKAITITSREVLDTRQPPLSYEYDDISDPFNGAP